MLNRVVSGFVFMLCVVLLGMTAVGPGFLGGAIEEGAETIEVVPRHYSLASVPSVCPMACDDEGNTLYSLTPAMSSMPLGGRAECEGDADAGVFYALLSSGYGDKVIGSGNDAAVKQLAVWMLYGSVPPTNPACMSTALDASWFDLSSKAVALVKKARKSEESRVSPRVLGISGEAELEAVDGCLQIGPLSVSLGNADGYSATVVEGPASAMVLDEDGQKRTRYAPGERFVVKVVDTSNDAEQALKVAVAAEGTCLSARVYGMTGCNSCKLVALHETPAVNTEIFDLSG